MTATHVHQEQSVVKKQWSKVPRSINVHLCKVHIINPSRETGLGNDGNNISRSQLADPIRPPSCFWIRRLYFRTIHVNHPDPRISVRQDIGIQSLEIPRYPAWAVGDDIDPRPIPSIPSTAPALIMAGDLEDYLAHRGESHPVDGAAGQVQPDRRVPGDVDFFSSEA